MLEGHGNIAEAISEALEELGRGGTVLGPVDGCEAAYFEAAALVLEQQDRLEKSLTEPDGPEEEEEENVRWFPVFAVGSTVLEIPAEGVVLNDRWSGAWVDGAHGHRVPVYAIRNAKALGFPVQFGDIKLVDHYERDYQTGEYDFEQLYDLLQDAIDWLNEHRAAEGYVFEMLDGEFGYWDRRHWADEEEVYARLMPTLDIPENIELGVN